jgi:hypothetical protein
MGVFSGTGILEVIAVTSAARPLGALYSKWALAREAIRETQRGSAAVWTGAPSR